MNDQNGTPAHLDGDNKSRLFGDRFNNWQDINGIDVWDYTHRSGVTVTIMGTPDPANFTMVVFGTSDQVLGTYSGTYTGLLWVMADNWQKWIRLNGINRTIKRQYSDVPGGDVERINNRHRERDTGRDNS